MRIRLVRHGESQANVNMWDPTALGDHEVSLTSRGASQAFEAGARLGPAAFTSSLVYCSPYARTRQTLEHLLAGAGVFQNVRAFEDPRLREVERGYQSPTPQTAEERQRYGYFYYRFNGGESPADCYDRICNFLDSMMRQAQRKQHDDVTIVTHGLTIRCFVMRFLHLTVEQFNTLDNPDNCDVITIALKDSLTNPMFVSGRWGVEGIRLRS